jgi:hypothetical protein
VQPSGCYTYQRLEQSEDSHSVREVYLPMLDGSHSRQAQTELLDCSCRTRVPTGAGRTGLLV